MGEQLGKIVAGLVVIAALALVLVSLGVIPAAEPAPVRTEAFDVNKAVEAMRTPSPAEAPPKVAPQLRVSRMPVCSAPVQGARAYRLALGPTRDGVLVWCEGGYQLFEPKLSGASPSLERIAKLSSAQELAGGAVASDFDGDGANDLVVGVAPRAGVSHQPGAGVYLVRGRSQGGYEPAHALVEAPTVALASAVGDGRGAPELLVLTRGDLAAQRPGELWVFTQAPTLTRSLVVPVGLDPRDLDVVRASPEGAPHALVVTGQPGAVVDVVLAKEALEGKPPSKQASALRGVQAFVPSTRGGLPFVRDPTDVRAVALEPALAIEPWAKGANVGPGVALDADGDGKPEVLAATAHGVALITAGHADGDELTLGEGFDARDLVAVRDATDRDRVLLLVEQAGEPRMLSLVLVPPPPWGSDVSIELEAADVHDAASVADVPLE